MLETAAVSACAWLLLAGAAFRHHQAATLPSAHEARLLRIAGGCLLALAFGRCGTDIDGERIVRMLAGASVSGVMVVLALSVRPHLVLAPVRMLLRLVRFRRTQAARPIVIVTAR